MGSEVYYLNQILQLLQQYLPGISSALDDISDVLGNVSGVVLSMYQTVLDYKLLIAIVAFTALLALILKRRFLV